MIVKDELLSKLRRYFDLNLYEVKLWAAILSRGVSTAGELSDIADVPRSRSYDVLESLEKKGFVVMKLGKPIKYIAIPPGEVVGRVKKNMHLNAQEKIKRLDGIKNSEMMTELDTLHTQGVDLVDPAELSGCIRGRHNLYNHLDLLVKEAKSSVNIMTTGSGFMRKVEALKPTFEKVQKKGVKIRILANQSKDHKKIANTLKGLAEVKTNKEVDARFCTIDGKDIVFMAMNDKDVHPTYDLGVWVKTPYFTTAMDGMFNKMWGK